ncbi:hypothetical protein FACS1894110_10090 [Spirochaetia bacterium]|nr:hypothetical protein FACS1894110_10090 [Spirochaetia bacterium]
MRMSFAECQKIISEKETDFVIDNDSWFVMSATEKDESDGYLELFNSDTVNSTEFMYGFNCYGKGLLQLLVATPNHKVKSVEDV